MITVKRQGSWWITDLPEGEEDCGPYDTRAEAEEDRRGLERFERYSDKRGFVSVDTPKP